MENQNQALVVRQLIVDLKAARQRLDSVNKRVADLERDKPQAFVEIRQAKNIAASARAIVAIYAEQLAAHGLKE